MTAIDIVVTVAGAIGFGFARGRAGCASRSGSTTTSDTRPGSLAAGGVDQPERRRRVRRGASPAHSRSVAADHGSGHRRVVGDRAFGLALEGSHEQAGLDPTAADRGDRHCPGRNRRRRGSSVCCSSRCPAAVAVSGLAAPLLVDVALWLVAAPLERALARRHITSSDRDAPSHLADGRRDHRLVRQDDDEGLRASPRQWQPTRRRHSGQLQQRRGALPGGQRAARSGHRGVRRRDGHVRAGRDPAMCEWVRPPIGVVDGHRAGAPRADALARPILEAKAEILECVADCGPERRRLRPRRRGRRQPPRGQARHRMQRGAATSPVDVRVGGKTAA